jgi:intein-encoded DNA endonuclease-like protein
MQQRISPQREFLLAVNEAIIGARKQGLSYKQIKTNIYKAFSFRISEQTIRQFVKNSGEVDVDKKESTKTKTIKEKKAPVANRTVDTDSNERIKSDINDI